MMVKLPSCDVLVVGAGPAGAMAALRVASAGINTWLIDAKRRIGAPPHCAGFVPARIFADFDISTESIVQKIDSMETRILDENAICTHSDTPYWSDIDVGKDDGNTVGSTLSQSVVTTSPGFIIDRVRFDRALAHNAARKGALVLCDTRLIGFQDNHWLIRKGTSVIACKPKYIVAADGAQSTTARLLKLPSPKFLVGVQVESPLVNPTTRTMVFFHKSFVDGYGWVFPKGIAANVGIGLSLGFGRRPWEILHAFVGYLASRYIIYGSVLATSRGLIPVSGPRQSLLCKNVLLCGDAAGLTHPVTGAGVSQALISGDMAGKLIVKAMTNDSPEAIMEYDAQIKSHFGNVMKHALSKRQLMVTQWDVHDFEGLCRRCWIAYKEYKLRSITRIRAK